MPIPEPIPERFRRLLVGLAFQAGAAVARHVPAAPARGVGRLAGLACWALLCARRAVVERNFSGLLERASEVPAMEAARKAFAVFGESVVDTLRLTGASRAQLARQVRIEDAERLEHYARDRGAVLLAAHAGNWEWAGAALAARGLPVASVSRPPIAGAGQFFRRLRARFGVRTASRLRDLVAGGSLGILAVFCDRPPARTRDRMRSPIGVARGAVALAARHGAVALPALALRRGDGGYRVLLGPALRPGRSVVEREACARRALEFLRHQLVAHPEQWFAFEPSTLTARPAVDLG